MSAPHRAGALGAATLGVLALALVPTSAAQAAPATAGASAATCKIVSYSPNKLVLGSATVKKTFSVRGSGSDCDASTWSITIFPYNSFGNTNKSLSVSDQTPAASFNPKNFTNADAGKNTIGAWVFEGPAANATLSFTTARAATFGNTLNATPEPVKKDKKITVKATLKRISWTWKTDKKMPYVSYSGQPVALQFEAKGTKTFKTVKTVKTGAGGKFSTTVTASKSGTWRVSFAGNSTTGSAVSTGDAVTVK
jgi:hypothetical protein